MTDDALKGWKRGKLPQGQMAVEAFVNGAFAVHRGQIGYRSAWLLSHIPTGTYMPVWDGALPGEMAYQRETLKRFAGLLLDGGEKAGFDWNLDTLPALFADRPGMGAAVAYAREQMGVYDSV